ncbi:MAG: hypothetical protein AB7E52_03765, partial [Bdellovibrionales bacterium]
MYYNHFEHKSKNAIHIETIKKMTEQHTLVIELSAVIVSVAADGAPHIVVAEGCALPSGPLETQHTKLEQALRSWVARHSGLTLGYVEQLYTFADRDRETNGKRIISIGYLALARDLVPTGNDKLQTIDWYRFFPWEDHRTGAPVKLIAQIRKTLTLWKNQADSPTEKRQRTARIAVAFPKDPRDWNEELVLQRYELLWQAGLLKESRNEPPSPQTQPLPGLAMAHDHRRIL